MELLRRKVKALSLGRIDMGQIGIMTVEDEGKWYNVSGETEALQEIIKNVAAKGNIIEFEYNNGIVGSLKLIEKAPEGEGFEMTCFEDLLKSAHEKFKGKVFDIKTEMISVDYEKKRAIFKANVVVGPIGLASVYTGHGDAEGISNDKISPHFIRMAETRAIVRALRWATNNATVAVEETEEAPIPQ